MQLLTGVTFRSNNFFSDHGTSVIAYLAETAEAVAWWEGNHPTGSNVVEVIKLSETVRERLLPSEASAEEWLDTERSEVVASGVVRTEERTE